MSCIDESRSDDGTVGNAVRSARWDAGGGQGRQGSAAPAEPHEQNSLNCLVAGNARRLERAGKISSTQAANERPQSCTAAY
jgi:hypothetical protein